MNLHWGYDANVASDLRQHAEKGGGRARSDWAFGNLQYKLNQYVTFAFEQSLYTTIAIPNQTTGVFTTNSPGNPRAKPMIVVPSSRRSLRSSGAGPAS